MTWHSPNISVLRSWLHYFLALVTFILVVPAVGSQSWSMADPAESEANPDKPKAVSIYWDTSYSMKSRDLDKELVLLDSYFDFLGQAEVSFREFGYELLAPLRFSVVNGDWKDLELHIRNITYDGRASTMALNDLDLSDVTLLFTDGQGLTTEITNRWEGVVYIINSSDKAQHPLLTETAVSKGGNYLPLRYISLLTAASALTAKTNQQSVFIPEKKPLMFRPIRGNITDFDDPLANVTVTVQGSGRSTRSDSKGDFKIEAKDHEILVFTATDRDQAKAIINHGTELLKITMPQEVHVLDEIVLEQDENDRRRETPLDKDVGTNFGKLDARKSGFAIKQIDGKNLSQSAQTIMQALNGKFSGIEIRGNLVLIRGGFPRMGTPRGAAWDVDGLLYPPENPPFHINVQNVANISIMSPSWSAARYGSLAAGGVIIVRTISQSIHNQQELDAWGNKRTNIYNGEARTLVQNAAHSPIYVQHLEHSQNAEEAYGRYLVERSFYDHRAVFFYDVYRWFQDNSPEKPYAARILSNVPELFETDPTSLKIAAYALEKQGSYAEALEIYKQIYRTNPTSQSLRDLANMYHKTGYVKRAWRLYSQYLGQSDSLYPTGTDRLVREEMLHLLRMEGEKIGFDTSAMDLEGIKNDVTLQVEWNNPNAQFDLQFVGPESLFYTWNNVNNSKDKNSLNGYLSERFYIEDIAKGPWMVNVTYLGNREDTPSFIKFTVKDHRKGTEWTEVLKLTVEKVSFKFLEIGQSRILTSLP